MKRWVIIFIPAAVALLLGACSWHPGHYHGHASIGVSGYYGYPAYYAYPYYSYPHYYYPYPYYYTGSHTVVVDKPYPKPKPPKVLPPTKPGWLHYSAPVRDKHPHKVRHEPGPQKDKHHYSRIKQRETFPAWHDQRMRGNRDDRVGKRSPGLTKVCFGRQC